ncbi:MAG TPA: MarC family protein [Myxococcaceae bacterium]|nr:MarC family protein [Myxococcaceae bacterium]
MSFFLVALPAVFFVVDPIGTVPLFLAMTARDTPQKARGMAARACVVGGAVLAFFALFGHFVFQMFGVSLAAFRTAGGVLLLITSLDMLRAETSKTKTSPAETSEGLEKDDIAIVPLAMPMLAGPGAIATVMVLVSRDANTLRATTLVSLSILITFLGTYLILRGATVVQRVLRRSGVAILERVMGLILAAIAVQFMADGAKDLWR